MRNLPEWHEKPLVLTVEEIADPMTSFQIFFTLIRCLNLGNI
jgi:hypothetical protein